MRKIQVIGYVNSEPYAKEVNRNTVISFKLVEQEQYKNSDGELVKKTHWYSCSYWRSEFQNVDIIKYLHIGARVYVEGLPTPSVFTKPNGEIIPQLEIVVKSIEIIR